MTIADTTSSSSNAPKPTIPELQPALRKRPGKYCAVVLLDRLDNQNDETLRRSLASLMRTLEQPTTLPNNLHVLCAVSPALIEAPEQQILPLQSSTFSMPLTQHDALLQVSATTRTDLIYALRICHGILQPTFRCVDEITGGQLRFDQEPFGFYHGNADEQQYLNEVARINQGPNAGGSWLLYQLYRQNMPAFYDQPEVAQEDVMGAPLLNTEPQPPRAYPNTAHTRVAHNPGKLPAMIRRGFAYRHRGHEGTAFIAAAADPKGFTVTLERMLKHDALLGFVEAVQGGLYFVPPNADRLYRNAPVVNIPATAQRLPLREPDTSQAPVALNDYLVSAQFTAYIDTLRQHTFFDGPVGHMRFHPDIQRLLEAINAVSSGASLTEAPQTQGGDAAVQQTLLALMEGSLNDANLFNAVTGKYMTVG